MSAKKFAQLFASLTSSSITKDAGVTSKCKLESLTHQESLKLFQSYCETSNISTSDLFSIAKKECPVTKFEKGTVFLSRAKIMTSARRLRAFADQDESATCRSCSKRGTCSSFQKSQESLSTLSQPTVKDLVRVLYGFYQLSSHPHTHLTSTDYDHATSVLTHLLSFLEITKTSSPAPEPVHPKEVRAWAEKRARNFLKQESQTVKPAVPDWLGDLAPKLKNPEISSPKIPKKEEPEDEGQWVHEQEYSQGKINNISPKLLASEELNHVEEESPNQLALSLSVGRVSSCKARKAILRFERNFQGHQETKMKAQGRSLIPVKSIENQIQEISDHRISKEGVEYFPTANKWLQQSHMPEIKIPRALKNACKDHVSSTHVPRESHSGTVGRLEKNSLRIRKVVVPASLVEEIESESTRLQTVKPGNFRDLKFAEFPKSQNPQPLPEEADQHGNFNFPISDFSDSFFDDEKIPERQNPNIDAPGNLNFPTAKWTFQKTEKVILRNSEISRGAALPVERVVTGTDLRHLVRSDKSQGIFSANEYLQKEQERSEAALSRLVNRSRSK